MASTATELTWLSFLLRDIGVPLLSPPTLLCDNMNALYMSINHVFYARTKHVELDSHFVREKVAPGSLPTRYVSTKDQIANILTKPLPKFEFSHNCIKLGLQPRPSLPGSNENQSQDQLQNQKSTKVIMERSQAQT